MIFDAGYEASHGEGFKVLTLKQMLQILPIVVAQVKAGNTSETFQNEKSNLSTNMQQHNEFNKGIN